LTAVHAWQLGADFSRPQKGATTVDAYLLAGEWYNLITYSIGETVYLSTPLTSMSDHVRGGSVLPFQGGGKTTVAARQTPFELVVALEGDLFLARLGAGICRGVHPESSSRSREARSRAPPP
jgi:hypothetical protein